MSSIRPKDTPQNKKGRMISRASWRGPIGSARISPFDVARLRAEGKLTPAQLKEEISRRFNDGTHRSPARPGISYMLSPVQRLYGGSSSKTVRFVNMPHYMFYAPNLTSKELGGWPSHGPLPLS